MDNDFMAHIMSHFLGGNSPEKTHRVAVRQLTKEEQEKFLNFRAQKEALMERFKDLKLELELLHVQEKSAFRAIEKTLGTEYKEKELSLDSKSFTIYVEEPLP